MQTRAIKTLNLVLEEMGRLWLPVTKDWRFNERHYGGLTGLDKAEFLERLEAVIEGRTAELVAEATGQPVMPAVQVLTPDETKKAQAALAATA